jgi:hypothetical protein
MKAERRQQRKTEAESGVDKPEETVEESSELAPEQAGVGDT